MHRKDILEWKNFVLWLEKLNCAEQSNTSQKWNQLIETFYFNIKIFSASTRKTFEKNEIKDLLKFYENLWENLSIKANFNTKLFYHCIYEYGL